MKLGAIIFGVVLGVCVVGSVMSSSDLLAAHMAWIQQDGHLTPHTPLMGWREQHTAQSLDTLVIPRIIITEEEEEKLGITPSDTDDATKQPDAPKDVLEGTTSQLPTFNFTTVTTTVTVPDAGTVLLTGCKRLKEAKKETGVPLLSKIPYVAGLFRNVELGSEAKSQMLMVTSRIIISGDNEEELLGLDPLSK